jgi:ribosomal protein L11 methylase PrmA
MSSVKIVVMGNPLILTLSTVTPVGQHRIGSVRVEFDHGEPIHVRVYGHVRIFENAKLRARFETDLRKYCENPAVLEQIIPYNGSLAKARRFNPSKTQVNERDWYKGTKKGLAAVIVS